MKDTKGNSAVGRRVLRDQSPELKKRTSEWLWPCRTGLDEVLQVPREQHRLGAHGGPPRVAVDAQRGQQRGHAEHRGVRQLEACFVGVQPRGTRLGIRKGGKGAAWRVVRVARGAHVRTVGAGRGHELGLHLPSSAQLGSVLGSWVKTMRDAVRNKERWKGAVRLPKILVLTSTLRQLLDAGS